MYFLLKLRRSLYIVSSMQVSSKYDLIIERRTKISIMKGDLERVLFDRISIEHSSAMALYYVLRERYTSSG